MIRTVRKNEYKAVEKIIFDNRFQNPYFYMDIEKMGFSSETIDTYIWEQYGTTLGYIYRYYNSLQLLSINTSNDYTELADFISSHQFEMASGDQEFIHGILRFITGYHSVDGIIMRKEGVNNHKSNICSIPELNNYAEIAELICSDHDIGGHYSISQLTKQLIERRNESGCRNLIIRKNGKIICHMGTYAETSNMAVLGGLITAPQYRGFGYGSEILECLAYEVQKDGKSPLLYCYEPSTQKWYYSKGWIKIASCSKLERNR